MILRIIVERHLLGHSVTVVRTYNEREHRTFLKGDEEKLATYLSSLAKEDV